LKDFFCGPNGLLKTLSLETDAIVISMVKFIVLK
jgi:hypothetical protein